MQVTLKKFFPKIAAIREAQPFILISLLFSLGYGLATTILGGIGLSLYTGMIGIYSLFLGLLKYSALKKYVDISLLSDGTEIQKAEKNCTKNIAIYATLMSFWLLSFFIVSTFFYVEIPNHLYGLWFVLFVSGLAFVKLILATINSIQTRKNHNKIIHQLKLTDNANALIAIGLTLRTILYFTNFEYARLISGISGIFFGSTALIVCLIMFIKIK